MEHPEMTEKQDAEKSIVTASLKEADSSLQDSWGPQSPMGHAKKTLP